MFSLSPTQQFLIARGLQSMQSQSQGRGMLGPSIPTPQTMQKPQGQPVSPQSAPAQGQPPVANNMMPGIMNRFRSMVVGKLPPQMQGSAANNMMPPQY